MGTTTTDGLLLVDKPAGLTSHDVVAVVRRALGERRIGHAGTLDPFATGLLVLLAGRGTRLIAYVDTEPKVYDATIRFGTETDSDDRTGAVVREAPAPSREAIDAALARLTGDLHQVPPAYSAKQVAGVRAYAAARRGRPLDLAPARVRVHEWTVRERRANELEVTITCSGGTYVRALARDLGAGADSAAHVEALRRVRSGVFAVTDAASLDAIERGQVSLRPLRDAVGHLEERPLDDREALRVARGNAVEAGKSGPGATERAALTHGGALVAVAVRQGGQWQPRVVVCDA